MVSECELDNCLHCSGLHLSSPGALEQVRLHWWTACRLSLEGQNP